MSNDLITHIIVGYRCWLCGGDGKPKRADEYLGYNACRCCNGKGYEEGFASVEAVRKALAKSSAE